MKNIVKIFMCIFVCLSGASCGVSSHELEVEKKLLIDSLTKHKKVILTRELDSICKQAEAERLRSIADSLLEYRIEEIKRKLKKSANK